MGKKKGNLGRSLTKPSKKKGNQARSTLHSIDDYVDTRNLQSVTESNDLSEFLNNCVIADTSFEAEKERVMILDKNAFQVKHIEATPEQVQAQVENLHHLAVPRRPPWTTDMDPAELDENERVAFLEWRRDLVDVEKNENLVLTPFEKNLEVWRQLWRVVERSNVLVQIVDSRNPLLFYSSDLVRYVHEVDPAKKNILLLNKADLLTRKQRKHWADHFRSKNIKFIFFSAYNEHVALEEEALAARAEAGKEEQSVKKPKLAPREEIVDEEIDADPDIAIMNSEDLIQYLTSFAVDVPAQKRLVVGMVGYPNVGKSSTINVLCKQKKVAESATPGKTKHFQTIILNEQVCLCDCPGLVFPSFIATKADMVCNGLLPIDQLRDHVNPVGLVCLRIPRRVFEQLYGITLPAPNDFEDPNRPPTPHELMQAYGRARGYMASHGQPDEPRSARYILKDYVMGRLLYAHPPPGEEPHEFNSENYANVPMSKQHFEDTVAGTMEQMQAKTPKADQVYKGKRKVRRRHQGEGQETVAMKTKGVRSVPYGQKLPTNIRL